MLYQLRIEPDVFDNVSGKLCWVSSIVKKNWNRARVKRIYGIGRFFKFITRFFEFFFVSIFYQMYL